MSKLTTLKPIDYLLIGNITADLQNDGSSKLGGTASFSGLTSRHLGHVVGVVSSHAEDSDIASLVSLQVHNARPGPTTCFQNITTAHGRQQYCYQQGLVLRPEDIPSEWRDAQIVHLGPVANEIDPGLFDAFPESLLCCTPQGLLRQIAADGMVSFRDLDRKEELVPKADVVVLSLEDLQGDEHLVSEYVRLCKLLVVTENKDGARVYWNGEYRHFHAPLRESVDETGAGDIFAACFFHRFNEVGDAWEAARFAVELAANSVTRFYLESVPTSEEIEQAKKRVN